MNGLYGDEIDREIDRQIKKVKYVEKGYGLWHRRNEVTCW